MISTSAIKLDNVRYSTKITYLDNNAIVEARIKFSDLVDKGILLNNSFDDDFWIISNEVQVRKLNFCCDRNNYTIKCEKVFSCDYNNYLVLIKAMTTLYFGASSTLLQSISNALRELPSYVSGNCSISVLESKANYLLDFITILPVQNQYTDKLIKELDELKEQALVKSSSKQRTLANYQSYLNFDKFLNIYWPNASTSEKIEFFPVFFWWKVTSILPLRPMECVLTPRDCLTIDSNGYLLTIRRTKQKEKKFAYSYNIEKDYNLKKYNIPENLANQINEYIKATQNIYSSDINTLFITPYYDYYRSQNKLNKHFQYSDLNACLKSYYQKALIEKYNKHIIYYHDEFNSYALGDDEIDYIKLGDTRHIAMINLITSGGNPEICMELAGHNDINISSSYYSNIKTFTEAITYKKIKQAVIHTPINQGMLLTSQKFIKLVDGGYCTSPKAQLNDFSDCFSVFDNDGKMLSCKNCPYYISPNSKTKISTKQLFNDGIDESLSKQLESSFDLLLFAIEQARKGLGYPSEIQTALLKLHAEANQYSNAIIQKYELED